MTSSTGPAPRAHLITEVAFNAGIVRCKCGAILAAVLDDIHLVGIHEAVARAWQGHRRGAGAAPRRSVSWRSEGTT
jgi:hypothetical protein